MPASATTAPGVGKSECTGTCLQAQADAMGTWGMSGQNDSGPRRVWEGDGRIDLRSVTNSQRQLPYHVRPTMHAAS